MGPVASWISTGLIALAIHWSMLTVYARCPSKCLCQNNTETANVFSVVCAQKTLSEVPTNLSADVMKLDLHGNRISSLSNRLQHLTHIEYLNISINALQSLNSSVFDNLQFLQVLDLSQNRISDIKQQVFGYLTNIRELNLADNELTVLDNEILFGLRTLNILILHGNKISSISNGTFLYMGVLEVLDISNNKLGRLSPAIFEGLISLKHLNLQNNFIMTIAEGTFLPLQSLQHLDLSYNNLTIIETNTFTGMPNLTWLALDKNSISTIFQGFMGNSSNIDAFSMDGNHLTNISIPLFQGLDKVHELSLSSMPSLTTVAFDVFNDLPLLTKLNLSRNPDLSIVHPQLLERLYTLAIVDLSLNNISTLSQLTFRNNHQLQKVILDKNPFLCSCGIAWLAERLQQNDTRFADENLTCFSVGDQKTVHLSNISDFSLSCAEIPAINVTKLVYFPVGSSARLECNFERDPTTVVIWTTPRQLTFTYHAFHPHTTSHLIEPAKVYKNGTFHLNHYWHSSSSYYQELQNFPDHIVVLADGSLYIDYVLRNDAGPYKCTVQNSYHNTSATITIRLDHELFFNVKIMSIIVGACCAASFLALNIVYVVVSAAARQLVNKRRRDAIRKLLENLDSYKTMQMSKLRDNYSTQLSRIRDQYHHQFDRLRDNYSSQMKRVKRGYSHQVERIRDNYTVQVGRLRNYSSHQIEQIRELYNNQLLKMRDYGSLQLERLHKKYKLQQQHMLKLLETMNLDNCKTVIETDCMRTESMIFDMNLIADADDRPLSPLSGSDSEYITASSSESSSQESLRISPAQENDSSSQDTSPETVHMETHEVDVEQNIQMRAAPTSQDTFLEMGEDSPQQSRTVIEIGTEEPTVTETVV